MNEADELRDLFAVNAILPLAAIGVDAGGKVDIWNKAAARLFGWSEDEVIGRPLPEAVARLASGHPGEESISFVAAKDGRMLGVECRFAARRAGGTIVIANDISNTASRERDHGAVPER